MNRSRRAPAIALCLYALASCVPGPREAPLPDAGTRPDHFPDQRYARAAPDEVFRIDPGRSQLLVYVYREGALARLGHNHVVASRDVHGYALLPGAVEDARFDLYVPLSALIVDDPQQRAAAGEQFASEPSEADKAGTRENMLGEKTLSAGEFPFAVVSGRIVDGALPAPLLLIEITLHGRTQALQAPASVEREGDALSARGRIALRQSDFGIAPFSVLGGALRVRDEVEIDYELYAVRTRPP